MSRTSPVRVLTVVGTRPEAIKMGPVISRLRAIAGEVETHVAVTGQHRSMLDQILATFKIVPDFDLDIMRENQALADITVRSLLGLEQILSATSYKMVIVQGDTTTAFAGALAAFYKRIPVAHVEAGLRTNNKYNPYPEEVNRHFIDVLAEMCFAPTYTARDALLGEGVNAARITVTGNTVIDALMNTIDDGYRFRSPVLEGISFNNGRRTILATVHRRENHGTPLTDICAALKRIVRERDDVQLVVPVHLNPNVCQTVHGVLGNQEHVFLTGPLDYSDFVNLMARSHLVLTDSGGVQEEAPSLGKPVLVLRDTTERPEAISVGTAKLIGTQTVDICSAVARLLDNPDEYDGMACAVNPYGDGRASERIVAALRHHLGLTDEVTEEFRPSLECGDLNRANRLNRRSLGVQ